MSNTAIAILPISMEAFEKLKLLKNHNFSTMSDNDFLIYMLDKLANDIKSNSCASDNLSAAPKESVTSDVKCKIEKFSVENPTDVESNSSNDKVACSHCDEKFSSELKLLRHYENRHKQPGQYKCSCGSTFDVLQLYLQHNFKCLNVVPEIKTEPTSSRKRQSAPPEEISKRIKSTNLTCDDCHRKFRTSPTLYLHDCKFKQERKISTPLVETTKILTNLPDKKPKPILAKKEDLPENLSMKSLVKFTCHCLLEFSDYNEYYQHSSDCGKTEQLESSFTGSRDRSSPLKVLPNTNGKFECADCTKSFTSILSLRQHRDGMHRVDPKYICKKCGKGYRWCTSFHYHKNKCTDNS